jgi:hypothetical protein
MGIAIFDTYKAVSLLRERGLSKEAAEGITEPLKDVTENTLVTKADLNDAVQTLKADFEKALHRQTWGLVGVIFAQGAFIITVLQVLQ